MIRDNKGRFISNKAFQYEAPDRSQKVPEIKVLEIIMFDWEDVYKRKTFWQWLLRKPKVLQGYKLVRGHIKVSDIFGYLKPHDIILISSMVQTWPNEQLYIESVDYITEDSRCYTVIGCTVTRYKDAIRRECPVTKLYSTHPELR